MATRKRHPTHAGLEAYCQLVDSCHDKGYVVSLNWDRAGWSLVISDGETLLATCESMRKFPDCLNGLATAAIVRLGRR